MSSKPSGSSGLPECLPKDFFDNDKKSRKVQEDDLAKELEQFEREMAALEAESEQNIKQEFDKLQDDKNVEELDQQLKQWTRVIELEKRAEELKNKSESENVSKKIRLDEQDEIDETEDLEERFCDWRSKGL